ncbi:MAG TPA: CHAP domain-containing protein [Candidatus Saccharimonadales bacterium]|nr:CHAP domain-containing protein [Candidatus Saccharimonadales bacterium]
MTKHDRRAAWFVAVLFLLISAVFAGAQPAYADDGGYPYASYNGPGSDAYSSFWTAPSGGNGLSPYGYNYRNCTDYVAWKLRSLGVSQSNVSGLGHGGAWATKAAAKGIPTGDTAKVGAAAVNTAGSWGHVAYVEAVNKDGTIKVSEYNWPINNGGPPYDGAYHTRTATPKALGFTKFVYFDGLMTNPPSGSGNTGGPLTTTVPLAVTPASPHMYEPLTFSYTVRTYASAVSVKRFTVAVRNSSGGNLDVPCNNGDGVGLPANTSWTCTAYLQQGYGSATAYTYWADWQDYNNVWHVGQLSGNNTFTVGQPYALTATQPVSVGPSGQVPMYTPLNWSYRVKNTSGAAASVQRFVVAVRGPGGSNLDVPCNNGNGVTLQAGTEWVCNVSLNQGYGSTGNYSFWADWQDYANVWHAGQLGGSGTLLNVTPAPAFTVTSALSVGPTSAIGMYQPAYWSFRVKNTSGAWTNVQRFVVAVRTPGGGAMDVPCNNGTNVTIGPLEEWTCLAYNMDGYGSTGNFTFWADWLGNDGAWHHGALSGDLTLRVGAPQQLANDQYITVSPSNSVAIGQPVTFTYRVRNMTPGGLSVKKFVAAVRAPNGSSQDVPCSGGNGVALASNALFTCTATVPGGFSLHGIYTFWADWQDYGDVWHPTMLSPSLPLYVG